MGCGTKCLKFIMFAVNFVFWITGAVMLGVGIWLAVDKNALDFLDNIAENPMDDPLFSAAVYIIIGVGAFIFLLGFLACAGTCMGSSCLLLIYIILVSVVLFAELIGLILALVFWKDIDSGLRDQMQQSLKQEYGKIHTFKLEIQKTPTTAAWDKMQEKQKCCGAMNYTDYKDSYWRDNVALPGQSVPVSCCKDDDIATVAACQVEAGLALTDKHIFLHGTGCHERMADSFGNGVVLIIILVVFLLLQIIGLVFACVLRRSITRYQAEQTAVEVGGHTMSEYRD